MIFLLKAEPKCPVCSIQGLKHIVSQAGTRKGFNVVFCKECGHVYGVYAKVPRSKKKTQDFDARDYYPDFGNKPSSNQKEEADEKEAEKHEGAS